MWMTRKGIKRVYNFDDNLQGGGFLHNMKKQKDRVNVLKTNYFGEADIIVRGLNQRGYFTEFYCQGSP